MTPPLLTPGRFAIISVPTLGFFAIPFLPFASEPTLWLGLPAVLVWCTLMVLASVAALQIVEVLYQRSGGAEADAREAELFAAEQLEQIRATRIAAEEAEGVR